MDNETECRLAAVAVTDTGMIIVGCAINVPESDFRTALISK